MKEKLLKLCTCGHTEYDHKTVCCMHNCRCQKLVAGHIINLNDWQDSKFAADADGNGFNEHIFNGIKFASLFSYKDLMNWEEAKFDDNIMIQPGPATKKRTDLFREQFNLVMLNTLEEIALSKTPDGEKARESLDRLNILVEKFNNDSK